MHNRKLTILMIIVITIISIVGITGCTGKEEKIVESGDTVYVNYIGTFPDGTVFDTSIEQVARDNGLYNSNRDYKPLNFTVDAPGIIKGFNDGVKGLKIGESRNITVQPADAYGEYDPGLVQPIPIKTLIDVGIAPEVNMSLTDGMGNTAVIKSIDETNGTVLLDMNHPMAGKVLQFYITVIDIDKKN